MAMSIGNMLLDEQSYSQVLDQLLDAQNEINSLKTKLENLMTEMNQNSDILDLYRKEFCEIAEIVDCALSSSSSTGQSLKDKIEMLLIKKDSEFLAVQSEKDRLEDINKEWEKFFIFNGKAVKE